MNLGILHHLAAGLCLAVSLTACAQPPAGPALPDWLSQRIAVFERTPEDAEAVEILALPHAGGTAYLFVAPCCDQFNVLYDAQGRRLCAPSGGHHRPRGRALRTAAGPVLGPAGLASEGFRGPCAGPAVTAPA